MNIIKVAGITLFSLCFILAYSQENYNVELVANVDTEFSANDVWGYVDEEGVEYALVGTVQDTRIYSLEEPSNPELISIIDGVMSRWRDIKVYRDHIYVTADEGEDGLLIIDMSHGVDSITHRFWKPDIVFLGVIEKLRRCHNLYIDTTQGYAYLAGCRIGVGGALILDLNQDPNNPVYVGAENFAYNHDVYVQDDKLYTSEIFSGDFAVYDVTDKSEPVFLAKAQTSFAFTHNAWASDDGNYLFTTDEKPNAFVDAYDISDLDDIRRVDSYQPIETKNTGTIPHNTHYLDGNIYTSWYSDGVIITDVHDPSNMVQVGSFDTYLGSEVGFVGCWGAYPFLPSGLLLASDRQTGLYVLQPKDNDGNNGIQRASYLSGVVTDEDTGLIIANADVKIISTKDNGTLTDALGSYKTGIPYDGEHEVIFSAENYISDTLSVILTSGEYAILDAQLQRRSVTSTEIIKDDIIMMFPNPVSSELHISAKVGVLEIANGRLYDMTGRVYDDFVVSGEQITLSMNDYPSGIYIVEISSHDGKVLRRKISKQ